MYQNDDDQWVLEGGPEWKSVYPNGVIIDGEDLVARNVRMTWFAGGRDPTDNNRGAYGDSTRDPDLVGVSLPNARSKACGSPPLPRFTADQAHAVRVRVYSHHTKQSHEARLVDIGPAAPPRAFAGIDGTIGLWTALGCNYKVGETIVDFRVIGGAKYLSEDVKRKMSFV